MVSPPLPLHRPLPTFLALVAFRLGPFCAETPICLQPTLLRGSRLTDFTFSVGQLRDAQFCDSFLHTASPPLLLSLFARVPTTLPRTHYTISTRPIRATLPVGSGPMCIYTRPAPRGSHRSTVSEVYKDGSASRSQAWAGEKAL